MPTTRSKLSKKNKYYIPEHRFLELKHFCLQYPTWKEALNSVGGRHWLEYDREKLSKTNNIFDPTMKEVLVRQFYRDKTDIIEQAAEKTDPLLYSWILKGVTEGRSYDNLNMVYSIPCDRNTYYSRYRKFFYILDGLQKFGTTN